MKLIAVSAAILAGILWASVPSAEAVPSLKELGAVSGPTPYDRHMTPVRQVLNAVDRKSSAEMDRVTRLLREARGFRYSHRDAYNPLTPDEVSRRRSGDCKDKSLWLLHSINAGDVHFVIGRMSRSSRINHAWLVWKNDGEWFVLDPTHHSRPLPMARLRAGQYVPFYSYSVAGSHRHEQQIARVTPNTQPAAVADTRGRTASKSADTKEAAVAETRATGNANPQHSFAARMARLDRIQHRM